MRRSPQQRSVLHLTSVLNLTRPAKDQQTPVTAVADWAEQASALLTSGIAAQRIPEILGTQQFSGATTDIVQRWAVVCAVWRIAEHTGAARGPGLQHVSVALRALDRLGERRQVLLAGPRSTVVLVCALPAVAWAMGWALGFDPITQLFHGWGALVGCIGLGLLTGGAWWLQRITERLKSCDTVVGLECVLLSAALGGGGDVRSAIRLVVTVVGSLGAAWCDLGVFSATGAVSRVVELSRETGAPLGQLLLGEAEESRNKAHAELEAAAESLAIRALIPLGVCVLPAFVLLGVVPIVLSVFGSVGW